MWALPVSLFQRIQWGLQMFFAPKQIPTHLLQAKHFYWFSDFCRLKMLTWETSFSLKLIKAAFAMTDHNPQLRSRQAQRGKTPKTLIILGSEISSNSRYMDWSSNYLFDFFLILLKNRMKEAVKREIFEILHNSYWKRLLFIETIQSVYLDICLSFFSVITKIKI